MVGRRAVLEGLGATRIFGDVATDGAGLLARRVGGIKEAEFGDGG